MSGPKQVFIASDHAGLELKAEIQKKLAHWPWKDLGPSIPDPVDYPDFAERLAHQVIQNHSTLGILICGSGIGMSIAANKIPGIRAAVVESEQAARLSRAHNDANVLCLGARLTETEKAIQIAKTWLETPFTEEGRHKNRIAKIAALENHTPKTPPPHKRS